MIERWFRSFKYEEAYLTQYNNIREARSAIGKYIHTYNFERRHSALDYQTPAECYYPAMLLPYDILNFLLLLTLNQKSLVNAVFYGNPRAK